MQQSTLSERDCKSTKNKGCAKFFPKKNWQAVCLPILTDNSGLFY